MRLSRIFECYLRYVVQSWGYTVTTVVMESSTATLEWGGSERVSDRGQDLVEGLGGVHRSAALDGIDEVVPTELHGIPLALLEFLDDLRACGGEREGASCD